MPAALLRLLFPPTCGSSLSRRLRRDADSVGKTLLAGRGASRLSGITHLLNILCDGVPHLCLCHQGRAGCGARPAYATRKPS